jgi:hypothetical protein
VLLAYLGALGIAAVRPFGKKSEWLLLLFSPWLFVTLGPLSTAHFVTAQSLGLLNRFIGLIPPFTYLIPLLFLFVLLFKGQAPKWKAVSAAKPSSGAFFKHMILPSLPLSAMLILVLMFTGMQGVLWPLLIAAKPILWPISMVLIRLGGQLTVTPEVLVAALKLFVLPMLLFFLPVFIVFQIFYLDRLALRAGAETGSGNTV